jgi:ArsR family transcriptional regulator, arsenate/arsenite/antimonite-responsive transcriptional repressor
MRSKDMAVALAALANETRLKMVKAMAKAGPEGIVGHEYSDRTGMARTLVSHHLKILVAAGIASEEKQGRTIRHRLDHERLGRLAAAVHALDSGK